MKEQIILGTLLGDAFIGKLQGRSRSYSIKWEHSKEQRDYAIWKADESLDNYSSFERSRSDKRTDNTYHSITCYSRVDDYKEYREMFYTDEGKQVSDKVLEKLGDLAIAVWFMDDGNLYYNGNNCHLTLSVNGFNEDSKDRIIEFFRSKYGIFFKKSQKALRITSVKQVKIWESYFKKHYHKSMMFKTLDFQKEKHNERKNR